MLPINIGKKEKEIWLVNLTSKFPVLSSSCRGRFGSCTHTASSLLQSPESLRSTLGSLQGTGKTQWDETWALLVLWSIAGSDLEHRMLSLSSLQSPFWTAWGTLGTGLCRQMSELGALGTLFCTHTRGNCFMSHVQTQLSIQNVPPAPLWQAWNLNQKELKSNIPNARSYHFLISKILPPIIVVITIEKKPEHKQCWAWYARDGISMAQLRVQHRHVLHIGVNNYSTHGRGWSWKWIEGCDNLPSGV